MTNENNKSDYNKPFMDLLKYLPEPYKSNANESLIGNLFNRFLSKQDVKKVSGYIGKGTKNAASSRQIQENDAHRQAFQLQPILNNKIGSIEHMASWDDIQNELTRLGVDIEDFAAWGSVQTFNWVPPIDINKLVNYKDYFWIDDDNTIPQYITIRNRCAVATASKTFWEGVINQYGAEFPVVGILPSSDDIQISTFAIASIIPTLGTVDVIGDAREAIKANNFLEIVGTVSNDGVYKVLISPTYDGTNGVEGKTTFTVSGMQGTIQETNIGTVQTRSFNKIVFAANETTITGDYVDLFEEDFAIFLLIDGNAELDNTFIKVVNSEYDNVNNTTTVEFSSPVSSDIFVVDSLGSLNQQLSIYTAAFNCQCGITLGFDDTLWDDNPEIPLWGDSEGAGFPPAAAADGISDHQNFLDRISLPNRPNPAIDGQLWYDIPNDILEQYSNVIGWKVIWNQFTVLLDATTGTVLWDLIPGCEKMDGIEAANQWIDQNKWQHRNDVINFTAAKRATQPIIEYDWDLELNEWTQTNYSWEYRNGNDGIFAPTTTPPPYIELEAIDWWVLDTNNTTTIVLDARYGDLTDYFVENRKIFIAEDASLEKESFEVNYSEYKQPFGASQYKTYITLKTVPSTSSAVGSPPTPTPNTYKIYPFATVNGDSWQGYGNHWLLRDIADAVPVPHQVKNPYTFIDPTTPWITASDYTYRSTIYAQQYSVTNQNGNRVFELLPDVDEVIDTRSLRRMSLFQNDDIRVYISDSTGGGKVRQFGNYEEIGEMVIDIINIDYGNNGFIVPVGFTQYFSPGDVLEISGNDVYGTSEFTVSGNGSPPSETLITVSELIPSDMSVSGVIYNKSSPISNPDITNIISQYVTLFVMGIRFFDAISVDAIVYIEVGPSSFNELGNTFKKIRMEEDNETYDNVGNVAISNIKHRKVEQVKSNPNNQYPLFDIFTSTGEPAYKANPIFGYRTDPESDVNINTGLRIVYDPLANIYEFDQFLLEYDDGELLTYRDYGTDREDFWYNPETKTLKFWKGTEWDEKREMDIFYRRAVISSIEPSPREREIDGLYWYNTTTNTLFRRFIAPVTNLGSWSEIQNVDTVLTDKNLRTIWRAGTNKDKYVPEKVDWVRRSQSEYNDERDTFIKTRVTELMLADSSLSLSEAASLATIEWHEGEANNISPTGEWVGEWEIPNPLYYNNLHENRKYLNSRELLTHFKTIISEQPRIPGYSGSADGMFALLPLADVNYSLGGTIKEFNDGFDTLLSSAFVDNVTPLSVVEFAHDQYESLLKSLNEIYREGVAPLLTNTEIGNIINLTSFVADEIIDIYERNDQYSSIYGDTTTFTDVDGVNDLGVKNWIATLPYVNLINKHFPTLNKNTTLDINEIVHHDGHRNMYALSSATIDIISQFVVNTPDPRTNGRNMGVSSPVLPSNNINEFVFDFKTSITNREGVYWYQSSTRTLYRYVVAESGTSIPLTTYVDGTLWMDTSLNVEVLRIKVTNQLGVVSWDIVDGLNAGDGRLHNGTNPSDLNTAIISAWSIVDIDELLSGTILELETRLYDNVPKFAKDSYDLALLPSLNTSKYEQYLEEAFLEYVSQLEIQTPYKNTLYDISDAFTWNYKDSIQLGGYSIISADGITNSFLVSGNETTTFGSNILFYIKNSDVNDGTWKTISSSYDTLNDTTIIFVEDDVISALSGVIFRGKLPSVKSISNPPNALIDEPNNLNDGSESGGDWRDFYTKLYNTPYPNTEPWVLQGYTEKPLWWDVEYFNDDEAQWGKRTWKYKHGFDVIYVENISVGDTPSPYGVFGINGNYSRTFLSGDLLTIDNSPDHVGNYNAGKYDDVKSVILGIPGTASIIIDDLNHTALDVFSPDMIFSIANSTQLLKEYTIVSVSHQNPENEATIIVKEEILAGDIPIGTTFINGVLYSPIINRSEIKLDTLTAIAPAAGRITKVLGMWENISRGVIPPNREYPNGVTGISGVPQTDVLSGLSVPDLPTFNYFSVNISNFEISTNGGTVVYPVDGILPPYWNFNATVPPLVLSAGSIDEKIRSVFFDFSTEIKNPNANYIFGDAGDVEWTWRTSSQFLYDQLTIAYRIDPSRFVSSTFGFNYTEINGLQIDRDVKNTPSHTRTNFHGDVVDDKQFISYGLNQWYVNFNRYNGYDANFSDFKELWTGWKAPLTYQFSSFVDTPSLSVGHRFVDVTNFDYSIKSKRSPGVDDYWLDAFKIAILKIPSNIIRYDNQNEWRFEINTNISVSREIKSYDVHNYQFYANTTTNECLLYSWKIVSVDTFNKTFTIIGDQSGIFKTGSNFDIIGSTGNDTTYNVFVSSYNIDTNTTDIIVNNNINSANIDGLIKADYREIPWKTGDSIYLSTTELLPIPLLSDTVNGLTRYYIVRDSNTVFRISDTKQNAINGIVLDITTNGTGEQFVGEVNGTFVVPNSSTPWRYYAPDKSNTITQNTPYEFQGMQNLINMISGYALYMEDSGWVFNSDKQALDPITNKIINWALETERFITFAYAQRTRKSQVNDSYLVTVDEVTDVWIFKEENKTFITGDSVMLSSSNGIYPTPFSGNIRYYIIRDSIESFRLAASSNDANNNIAIDVLSTNNIGDMRITIPSELKTLTPEFEINAFRSAIWFKPPRGIVSNIVTGPVDDIRSSQLIYNQNGNRINEDQIRVYRNDKETNISVLPANTPDTTLVGIAAPIYDLSHLGGLHLFIDIYEHVMVFNNYTSEGNLLYDPFIGLNVTKYEMLFNRQPEFTHRPNVGGYYLETFFNQGSSIKENFESGIENLRNAYDTYETFETNLMTEYSRRGLGYEGTTNYLTNLNLSQKSQFIFWRGQIQSKGSVAAVKAFINSRRFIDAKIDDFWAVKIGEFGSMSEKEFPELFVTTVDSRSNELRLEFVDNDLDLDLNPVQDSFKPIKMTDQDRWYNQPDQIKVLSDNGRIMYFDMKAKNKLEDVIITGSPNHIIDNIVSGKNYIKHDLDSDSIEITQYNPTTLSVDVLTEDTHYTIINNNIIDILDDGNGNNITIWGMAFNDDAQSPARIIDRASQTQISPIQFWDPSRGVHYKNAIHNIDLWKNDKGEYITSDPAEYDNNNIIRDVSGDYSGNWKDEQIGTTWMNMSKVAYQPYYSELMIPDTTERFRSWGQLAEWAEYEIFEWVESDVPPTEWDALAVSEEGDRTIVEHLRKSGIAKRVLLEKDPETGSPGDWIVAENIIYEYNAAEAPIVSGSYVFDSLLPSQNLSLLFYRLNNLINIYINGKLYKENMLVSGSPVTLSIPTTDMKENDVVAFIQHLPPQDDIDAGIETGVMLYDYEHSAVQFFDELGTEFFKYYFWVSKKRTKPLGKNRTMPIAEAEIQLNSIPTPHMFFQKILPADDNVDATIEPVQRNDVHTITALSSPPIASQTFEYHVTPLVADSELANDTVVKLNGVVLSNGTDYSIDISGSPAPVVNISPLLQVGDIVEIDYTGEHSTSIELPYRYSQTIIRGLQGVVNADRRYSIRFNRNFTLRDTIDVENEKTEPLDLKNLHTEWKIFRQEQQHNIDRWQWDRITECIVGFKLTDPTVRVPSYERELYDEKFNTDTQYGLEDGQAFTNGSLALNSILSYLLDSGVDFTPININTFFINNSFDTPDDIIKAMDEIYNTFIFSNINRMYFSVLKDAFTTKAKYPGILKTSMVSLHGIRVFQRNGIFDD